MPSINEDKKVDTVVEETLDTMVNGVCRCNGHNRVDLQGCSACVTLQLLNMAYRCNQIEKNLRKRKRQSSEPSTSEPSTSESEDSSSSSSLSETLPWGVTAGGVVGCSHIAC